MTDRNVVVEPTVLEDTILETGYPFTASRRRLIAVPARQRLFAVPARKRLFPVEPRD